MAEGACGASVQGVAIRVAALEPNGVPQPGPGRLYVSDAFTEIKATPEYQEGADITKPKANGNLCVVWKQPKVLKRYNMALTLCSLDPELEHMLVGGLLLTEAGETVGATSPEVGVIEVPDGVSVEVWSRHVVDGDQDATWPYIHWVWPRTRWNPGETAINGEAQDRLFEGYTSQNPNWFDGPANDWTFDSSRSMAYAFTRSVPEAVCGSQTLAAS